LQHLQEYCKPALSVPEIELPTILEHQQEIFDVIGFSEGQTINNTLANAKV
jgi:hypothetical protein